MPDTDNTCAAASTSWLADERQLRLECIRLAGGSTGHAQQILNFVTGRSDRTPREKIVDALREAGVG